MKKAQQYLLAALIIAAASTPVAAAQTTASSAGTPQVNFEQREVLAVDRLLILLQRRLNTAYDVARAKYNSGAAIEDKAREAVVIEAAGKSAQSAGVQPDLARAVFAAQIEASKTTQRGYHAEWKRQNLPKFRQVPDLTKDVRPVLDRLTPAIVSALKEAQPTLMRPGAGELVRQRAALLTPETVNGFRGEAWQQAFSPLTTPRP